MLRRGLHIASRQLFYLLVIGTIAVLLALLAAVWLSDEIAKRKDEIASWASEQTGYPVEIGAAGMYWLDLIPKLEVRDVRLLQKNAAIPVVTANNMHVSLDILSTIVQGEPVLADASIQGAQLSAERDNDGQISLSGLDGGSGKLAATPLPQLMRWMSWFKSLELSSIDIHYSDKKQQSLSGLYRLTESELSFDNNQWQGSASVELPDPLGNLFTFTGQAGVSDEFELESWQWKAQAEQISLKPLVGSRELGGIVLKQGMASATINAARDADGSYRADLALDLSEAELISIRENEAFTPVSIEQLKGYVAWQKQGKSWQLSGTNIELQIGGETWPLTKFLVDRNSDGTVTAQADYLSLSDITSVAMLLDEPPAVLAEAKPAGDISQLELKYTKAAGLEKLAFNAREVAMLPWQHYPGANNLSFTLDWHDGNAQVGFNSYQTSIYAEDWFDDAVFLDSLTGHLGWQKQQTGWTLTAEQLSLWNEDLSLELQGRVQQQADNLDTDLTLTMQDVAVNRWQAYVPQRFLNEDFKAWVTPAFKQGMISHGVITMKGNPADFPFDDASKQGSFEMNLQAKDVQLHYGPGWPDLSHVTGEISGQGNNLLITSQSGEIAGFAFKDVTTTIDNLVKPGALLKVDGTLSGATADALAFLQNSPLKQRFGTIAEWLKAEGKSNLRLALTIPLRDVEATQVSGDVAFENNKLTLAELPGLPITAINGLLNFDNNGVSAKNITARTLGEKVSIDVAPVQAQTMLTLSGQTSVAEINKAWPGSVPAFVDGRTPYQARVAVMEQKPGQYEVEVDVDSDLKGVDINLPEPYGKKAAESRKLSLAIKESRAAPLSYRIVYADHINAAFTIKNNQPYGQIRLGAKPAELTGDRLSVVGHIDTLSLDEWQAWQAVQPETDAGMIKLIDTVGLSVGQLISKQQAITELMLTARQHANDWQLDLYAPQLKGRITLPQDLDAGQPMVVALDYLKLKLPESAADEESAAETSLWPSLQLKIDDLQVDDVALGRLDLIGKRLATAWSLENASLESPVMKATASGNWTQNTQQDQSRFDIEVSTDDMKALLAHFGYQPVMTAKHATLSSQLSWQGDPLAFSRQNLNGTLNLDVGRGELQEVEPGAAGRIFGLLSIATIPRRLALDFSDLFGKGFNFTSIKGNFALDNGIARTDDLVMLGESATIAVKGPIDMVNKTYDQEVVITPNVSSTLPLAGAVAGGPVGLGVGTAILIFDKLAGDLFDREIVNLISYRYKFSGPWDSPELTIVNPAEK